MNPARWVLMAIVIVLGASCGGIEKGGGSPAPDSDAGAGGAGDASMPLASGYFNPALANGEAAPAPSRPGLQYSGAVALLSSRLAFTATAPASAPDAPAEAWIELSAAILPKVSVLYTGQGDNYPATPQAQAKLVHDSALTFATLLRECQPLYPGIVLWQAGDPLLSDTQVSTNYQLLEACAYERYLAKPYWIPQLIHDVDICRQELGPGWRMLTEADVLALAEADAQRVQETLAGVQNPGSHPDSFYFSLSVWVLGNDGSVGAASLRPGSDPSFTALASMSGMSFDPRVHYEGGLTLRCLRVTSTGGI